MSVTQGPPPRVGLCPNPDHYGEFYVPLDATERGICPDGNCNAELIVFARAAEFEPMPEGGWLKGHKVLWRRRWPGQVVDFTEGRPGTLRRYLVQVYGQGLFDLAGDDLVFDRRGRAEGRERRET